MLFGGVIPNFQNKVYERTPLRDAIVGVALLSVAASAVTMCRARWWGSKRLEKVRQKRLKCQQNTEAIERSLQTLDIPQAQSNEICDLPLKELQEKIQNGDYKAVQVLHAYQTQAIAQNKSINAINEMVTEAEAEAEACDRMKQTSDRPLHGVPVSIKECFPMKGYDCVLGFSNLIGKPFAEDCVLIKVLKHQGAIPFARTNVPQTMISYDTCNPVFGQTYNPHGTKRTSGGSSGGEAALVAAKGSIIGLGGDIGGSIRIPAAFCGIAGFKPMTERFSKKGGHDIFKGQDQITSAYGPMARDVDSLVTMMKAILCPLHFELDPTIPPVPFRTEIYEEKRKPRVGYYLHDGFVMSTPHMQRAVRVAVEALTSTGYEVAEWKFSGLGVSTGRLWGQALFADGGAELFAYLKNDVSDHSFSMLATMLKLANFKVIHWLLHSIVKRIYHRLALSFENLHGVRSVVDWQQYVRDLSSFRAKVLADMKTNNIDVLIAPAFAMPAPPVELHKNALGAGTYTAAFNVLNFPAGTLPVTVANAEDSAKMADYPTPDPWHKTIKQMCIGAEGLPIGVQVVSQPWQEERCLRVMKDLETALNH